MEHHDGDLGAGNAVGVRRGRSCSGNLDLPYKWTSRGIHRHIDRSAPQESFEKCVDKLVLTRMTPA